MTGLSVSFFLSTRKDIPDESGGSADPVPEKPLLLAANLDSAHGEGHSYKQLLRSWSVLGGSSTTNYLISLVKIKILAVILGPSGIGLIGLYSSAIDLFTTIPNGISNSGVREIARASSDEELHAVARPIKILWWAGLIVGILGWLAAILLAKPIGVWLLHSDGHVTAISILGAALFLNALTASRVAVLKGLRKVKYLAWTNVLSALLTTFMASFLYYVYGLDAIVPVLVLSAAINFGTVAWFCHKITLEPQRLQLREAISGIVYLLHLGVAFIMTAMTSTGLDMLIRVTVVNALGLHAAGIYQAAWTISGTFAGVVLSAVGADFFPRLAAVINDEGRATRLINRQLELGVLLSLPILLIALAFAPLIMRILYSAEFVGGSAVLRWLMVAVFLKVLSWPVGFVPLAKRRMRWVLLSQTVLVLVQVPLLFWLGARFGLIGIAQASVIALLAQGLFLMWTARRLVGFAWTPAVRHLILIAFALVAAELLCQHFIGGAASMVVGLLIALFSVLMSMRVLAARLEWDNLVVRRLAYFPGIGTILAALK